ncbi:MAG: bifunctional folylpolyglutamate synthase/dihydrofolate synthase [Acidimicrobiales bacterium]|nr:bifunctional folylpolyglutamate synthase/dihydrofolate synthase [Acidimicrobiales bacterium]
MDYSEAVAYLDAHIGLGGEPGLDRIRGLLDDMGGPHLGYPMIHVAGTNGKTSTTRFATLLCLAHGLSTGTCISPHLQRIEERFAADGHIATEEEFALAISDVAAFADLRPEVPYSYFELLTAGAFAFFADRAVDAAVVEVGLGGRLDATNVIDAEVCVVTSVGLDHVEYLGSDLAGIAREKVAIAGPQSVLVTGPMPPEAHEVMVARARELGIHHRSLGHDFDVVSAERGVGGWLATLRGAEAEYPDVFVPLHGRHQLNNLVMAIAGVEALFDRALDVEAVREAALAAEMPGRMEPVSRSPLVLIDGAHNVEGIDTLVSALREEFPTTRWQLVFGAMGDKDVPHMLEKLAPLVEGLVVTAVDYSRAVPPAELADQAARVFDGPILAADDVGHALDKARAEAGPEGAVLVCGSLYLVGEVRDLFDPD